MADRLGEARRELASSGASVLADALDGDVARSLAAEAKESLGSANLFELTSYELGVDGQAMRSPLRLLTADPGEALGWLHEESGLHRVASRLAGTEMVPSHAAYLHFRPGDFIGLHLDLPACERTFLVAVAGDVPPLVVYPELRDKAPEWLLEAARESAGAPSGGQPMAVPQRGLLALDGGVSPHQTPSARGAGTLVSLCYVSQ